MSSNRYSDLEKQISVALTNDKATPAVLADLLIELEDGIGAADVAAKAERDKALDPITSPDAKAARQAAEDAVFLVNRLSTLKPRLEVRLTEVLAQERLMQWRADYEQLKGKRDALAEEVREYPAIVAKLVDLFSRVAINDAEIGKLHRARPAGVSLHLRTAELEARGLDGFTRDTPSIIEEQLKLPDWQHSERMAWPPPKPSEAAAFAASMALPMHRGADWWKDGDARAAEQAAEAARVARYYADQPREREKREAAEERTRATGAHR